MTNFEELIKKKEKELISENLLDLRKNINNNEYNFKISNYCERYHFNIDDTKNQILSNDIIA